MEDAVSRYCTASEHRDIDALLATLAPDAELVSPLAARAVFRGNDDLRALLTAVYTSLEGWHWGQQIGDGPVRVVLGEGRVLGLRLGDAMVFELAEDGLIRRVRPHLRPWLATSAFALSVAVKLAPDPGILARAMRPAGA